MACVVARSGDGRATTRAPDASASPSDRPRARSTRSGEGDPRSARETPCGAAPRARDHPSRFSTPRGDEGRFVGRGNCRFGPEGAAGVRWAPRRRRRASGARERRPGRPRSRRAWRDGAPSRRRAAGRTSGRRMGAARSWTARGFAPAPRRPARARRLPTVPSRPDPAAMPSPRTPSPAAAPAPRPRAAPTARPRAAAATRPSPRRGTRRIRTIPPASDPRWIRAGGCTAATSSGSAGGSSSAWWRSTATWTGTSACSTASNAPSGWTESKPPKKRRRRPANPRRPPSPTA